MCDFLMNISKVSFSKRYTEDTVHCGCADAEGAPEIPGLMLTCCRVFLPTGATSAVDIPCRYILVWVSKPTYDPPRSSETLALPMSYSTIPCLLAFMASVCIAQAEDTDTEETPDAHVLTMPFTNLVCGQLPCS